MRDGTACLPCSFTPLHLSILTSGHQFLQFAEKGVRDMESVLIIFSEDEVHPICWRSD